MQKIGLLVHKEDKEDVLAFMQEHGVLHLSDAVAEEAELGKPEPAESLHELHYKVGELEFATQFLKRFEVPKKGLQARVDGDAVKTSGEEVEELKRSFKFKPVVEACKKLEEAMVDLHNEEKSLRDLQAQLKPWAELRFPLSEPRETQTVRVLCASVSVKEWSAVESEIAALSDLMVIEMDGMMGTSVYFRVVCEKSLTGQVEGVVVSHKGDMIELPSLSGTPKEELQRIDRRFHEIKTQMKSLEKDARAQTKHLKELRILYDAYNWEKLRAEADKNFRATASTLFITGWVPKEGLDALKKDLSAVNPTFEIFKAEPEDGEQPPVLLKNKGFMKPFESVTNIYGLPLPQEVDPTPYLAAFFIVFFGLALTDAIYGLLMFAVMFSVLRFLKIPKESQGLIRLLMYAGIITFLAGALFGGWASLDPTQVPSWLTTTDADGDLMFIGQKISAIKDPMGVLILSLVLGYIQVLFGVIISFVHRFRHDSKLYAMIDQFPWVFILSVIGLIIMVAAGILPETLQTPFMYLLYVAIALIVLTQGREKKNPIMKLLSGVLGLYGLVGYLSDVLSYSRLLALGLATSIIGLAVNTIAGMVNGVPFVGIFLAIVVLAVGHTFNLGINALGAFIHSGRLQFVEFFTKFLEGGGKSFSPLRKESKYVRIRES